MPAMADLCDSSISNKLFVIGEGTCGTVFSGPSDHHAFKKGGNAQDIQHDCVLTLHVHNSLEAIAPVIQQHLPKLCIPRTPRSYRFTNASNTDFWTIDRLEGFPSDHRKAQPIFKVDLINGLSESCRKVFLQHFFQPRRLRIDKALQRPENQHCLARIYLGPRSASDKLSPTADLRSNHKNLRNFPMYADMLDSLGYDTSILAEEMAIGLAMLHWAAQVNGMDTEFVLASAQSATPRRSTELIASTRADLLAEEGGAIIEATPSRQLRQRKHLWLLDFDKASKFDLTEEAVRKSLVPSFLGNDQYFPMPDGELWPRFEKAYLKAGAAILKERGFMGNSEVMLLPSLFLVEVERKWMEHKDWDPEEEIVFGE